MSNNETTSATDADATPDVPQGSDYVSDRKFADFPIAAETLKGILDHGYVVATPVQAATIDAALAGKDLLVRAKTGTGKTAAFVVPSLERVPDGRRCASTLMLAPTRELAQQIAEECRAMAKYRDLGIAVLVGGLAMGPQEKALDGGAEIIVGTPGRVLDHIRRGNLDLSQCLSVTLDEADEMLSMGFYQDVTKILDSSSGDRQVLLFSATISGDTERLVKKYLKDPENIRLSTDADNVDLIEHVLYETSPKFHKIRSLLYLLDMENPTSAIIFCNTREDTATVATFLDRQGLDVQLLSGELSQARRSQVMKAVKGGVVRFLVATDVAARGIDISDLSHVINYSLPQDPSVYLHRTGRTGRIGKKGTAINLVGGPDMGTRKTLETVHKIDFNVKQLPSPEECVQLRVERQAARLKAAMSTIVFESYLPTVRALKERPDGDALLAAALRTFFQWDREQRAAASDVDSLGEIRRERSAKAERNGRSDRKGRGDDSRRGKKSGGRSDRKKPARPSNDELDAMLSGDANASGDGDSKSKRRRKRRRKKKGGSESENSGSNAAVSDLDALLSAD